MTTSTLHNFERSVYADVTFKILMTVDHLLSFLKELNVVVCVKPSFAIVGIQSRLVGCMSKLFYLVIAWSSLALWTFEILII